MVAAAEGKKDAMFTVLGALTGAFLFSLVFPAIESTLIARANFGSITLEHLLGFNGIYIAIPFSLALLGLAFFVLKDRYE